MCSVISLDRVLMFSVSPGYPSPSALGGIPLARRLTFFNVKQEKSLGNSDGSLGERMESPMLADGYSIHFSMKYLKNITHPQGRYRWFFCRRQGVKESVDMTFLLTKKMYDL